MEVDYKYISKANPFAFVNWSIDGDYVAVDCDPTDEELQAMFGMVDVEGWDCE